MIRRTASRFSSDRRGATAVEFAMIAPVFLLLMMGSFDLAHQLYMRSVLQGSVQKSARDSSLEKGTEAEVRAKLDAQVENGIHSLANSAKVTFKRRFYRSFVNAAAAQAEPFPGGNDTNKNGRCDNNEVFVDLNRNGIRDMDGGDAEQGGAQDKTVYTVAVTFPRLFPVWRFIGGQDSFEVLATTVLANQPYADQGSYTGPADGHCRS